MISFFLINILEVFALIAGVFYYNKNKSKPTYYLIWFLGITVFTELFGWYAYFVESGFLSFLKGTVFESNYWSTNIYSFLSYLFYIQYFKWFLKSKKSVKFLDWLSVFFVATSIVEVVVTGGFFSGYMPISNIVGTLFIFLSTALYYIELLQSDQILKVYKSLPFYVSVGALVFHLCTTPIFIYSAYYSVSIDPSFVNLYRQIIFGSNYILYSIYIAGFIICYKTKNLYSTKKNF